MHIFNLGRIKSKSLSSSSEVSTRPSSTSCSSSSSRGVSGNSKDGLLSFDLSEEEPFEKLEDFLKL